MRAVKTPSLFHSRGFRLLIILAACLSGLPFLASLAVANDLPLLADLPSPTGVSRRWSAGLPISPYSQVDMKSGRVITALPVTGWGGRGPGISLTLYHNMTSAWGPPYIDFGEFPGGGFFMGDIDGSGLVDVDDIPAFVDIMLEEEPTEEELAVADMDLDEQVGDGDFDGLLSMLEVGDAPMWSHTYQTCLVFGAHEKVTVIWGDGTRDVYTHNESGYQAPAGVFNKLQAVTTPITGYKITSKSQHVYLFNEDGRLETISDPSGNTVTCHYIEEPEYDETENGFGELAYVRDAAGRTLDFLYNAHDKLKRIKNPEGRMWYLLYFDSTDVEHPSADADGPFVAIKDPMNFVTRWTYTNTYDWDIETVTDKDENTYVYEYTTDNGRLLEVQDPEENPVGFWYTTASGKVTGTYTDVRGNDWIFKTSTALATMDSLLSVTNPLNETTTLNYTTYKHDPVSIVDARGKVWHFNYDSRGNVLEAYDPYLSVTTYTYDTLNNLLTITPPGTTAYSSNTDKRVTLVYGDSLHPTSPTEIQEPAEASGPVPTTTIEYYGPTDSDPWEDAKWHGLVKRVMPPAAYSSHPVVTEAKYDFWGQPSSIYEGAPTGGSSFVGGPPPGVQTTTDRNQVGQPNHVCDGRQCGDINHDDNGRVTNVDCKSASSFTGGPNVTCLPKGEGADCSIRIPDYPPWEMPPDGCTVSEIEYTSSGRAKMIPLCLEDAVTHDSTPRYHTIDYDTLGRPTTMSVESSEATGPGGPAITHGFTYDYSHWISDGQVSRESGDGEVTTVTVDAANRVTLVERVLDGVFAMSIGYTYYADGSVDTVTNDNGTRTKYTYDNAGRVTVIRHETTASSSLIHSFAYTWSRDGLLQTILETYPDPTNPSTTLAAYTTYTYDRRGQLVEENRIGENEFQLQYTYDLSGNRLMKWDVLNDVTTEYVYDVSDPDTYGSQGNRLVYSKTTELVESVATVIEERWYDYDYGGRLNYLVQRIAGDEDGSGHQWMRGTQLFYNGGAQVWGSRALRWQYDSEDEVINASIQYLAAMEYRYDGSSRYLTRPRNPTTLEPLKDSENRFRWETGRWSEYEDGGLNYDYTASITRDSEGEIDNVSTARRVSYLGGEEQFAHGTSEQTCGLINHVGTVGRVTNDSAAVIQSNVYSSFGEPIYASGSGGNRFGFAGAVGYGSATWDSAYGECPAGSTAEVCDPLAALGFLHVGARYYDPSSGRFIQRDPIGISGGLNTYVYCGNNPVTGIDPSGLCPPSSWSFWRWMWFGNGDASDELWNEFNDELAMSVSDRTLGVGDSLVDHVPVVNWFVKSVGGPTFDPVNRANSKAIADPIISAVETLYGQKGIKILWKKIGGQAEKKLLFDLLKKGELGKGF